MKEKDQSNALLQGLIDKDYAAGILAEFEAVYSKIAARLPELAAPRRKLGETPASPNEGLPPESVLADSRLSAAPGYGDASK